MSKDKDGIEIDNFKSTANLTDNLGFQSSLSVAEKGDELPYNPAEHRNLPHPNTVLGSIIHLLKACLGTGLLAMPAAFKNSGLIIGTIGIIFVGVICTHTIDMLVRTSQELCVIAKKPSMSFSETCGAAFAYGPKRFQGWSAFVKTLVDYSLSVCYISVLCVYIVFIGSTLKEVIDMYYPDLQLSIQMYCALTLVPLVLICQIRNLKYLVPFSGIANVCVLVVFSITLYYVFRDLPPVSERETVASVATWPLFFSTAVFAMEGIGVMLPIENEMSRPEMFLSCPGVLNSSMIVVVALYGVVGFFGYVQYGDYVKGSITLNLPETDTIAQATKLLMAFVIFLSFALQFYVPMEIISRKLKERKSDRYENVLQIGIRTFIVCVSVAVAAMFPNLELVIGFVGAIFFSTLGLLFPVIVHSVYRWERDLHWCVFIKNIVIGIVAIVALVSGAYVSIEGIVEDFFTQRELEEIVENSTLTY